MSRARGHLGRPPVQLGAGCGSCLVCAAERDREGEVASQLDEGPDERELQRRLVEAVAVEAAEVRDHVVSRDVKALGVEDEK